MKEINRAYFEMDMSKPEMVLEYLTLISTKPMWRVSLMGAILLSLISTSVYVWSNNVSWGLYLAVGIMISYIVMGSYISFYSFHVVMPNGGQEQMNKLHNAYGVAEPRWS